MDENKNLITNPTTLAETFDSWTLVTENTAPQDDGSNSNNRNEDSETKKNETLGSENLKLPEVNIEELSDGISVISESEMIDEYSERFSLVNENLYSNDSHTENESDTSLNLKPNIQDKIVTSDKDSNRQLSDELKSLFTVKKVASGFFYATLFIVLLAFIGKIKVFHDMISSTEISLLEERIGNLELHNNLLRAEIDILQKKITYFSNQLNLNTNQFNKNQKYQTQSQNQQDSEHNQHDKQKYSNKNADVTSGCENNEKYINGICITFEGDKSIKTEMKGNVPKSENTFNGETKNYDNVKVNHHQNETPYMKYKKEKNDKFQNYKNYEHKNLNSKDDGNSVESNENINDDDDKNNYSFEKYKRDKKNGYRNLNKYENKKDQHNSKEYKEYKYDKSKEYIDKKKYDNDWHDKLMDSRENFRKQKSKEKDNNWYVERGHSREEFRIFENDDYKKKGKIY